MEEAFEVLAHISAPSKAVDDSSYRAQAAASLEFDAISKTRVSVDGLYDEHAMGCYEKYAQSDEHQPGSRTAPEDSKASTYHPGPVVAPHVSLHEPLLGIPPNSRNNLTLAPQHPDVIDANSSYGHGCSADTRFDNELQGPQCMQRPSAELLEMRRRSSSFETPLSEVPDSQHAFSTSAWDVETDKSPDTRGMKIVQISRSPSDQTPSKRQRLSISPSHVPSSIPEPTELLSTNASSPTPGLPQGRKVSRNLPVPTSTTLSFPLEINAPPPEASSSAQFTTHITSPLKMLAETLRLSRVFKPRTQTRPIKALERGYWFLRLDISDPSPIEIRDLDGQESGSSNRRLSKYGPWSLNFFSQFWSFLSTFIEKEGRAGWGVWCICNQFPTSFPVPPADSGAKSQRSDNTPNTNDGTKQLVVKLYTWGEIAPHMYLLMYLASERRVKRIPTMEFRDAKEEPVIIMS